MSWHYLREQAVFLVGIDKFGLQSIVFREAEVRFREEEAERSAQVALGQERGMGER